MMPMEGWSSRLRVTTLAALFMVTAGFALVAASADGAAARATPQRPASVSTTSIPPPNASAGNAPIADFVARQDRMTSTFDASASYSPVLSPIVSYEWVFGDGSTGTGVR